MITNAAEALEDLLNDYAEGDEAKEQDIIDALKTCIRGAHVAAQIDNQFPPN
ncbi:hypothetical protein [Anaeroselena agilis]|uniref:Uncharacterized protein n=1 Tax=Anaeroselena agilis TaxID=3063788 RepID=A0ABU3NVR2_9FIRM|nr:hypothetical protein [Selenomonadales bacterium 4137-cl]